MDKQAFARLLAPTLRRVKERKPRKAGGGGLTEADEAAMSPETFANPAVKQALANAGRFPLQSAPEEGETIRYRTASPLVNITDQDIDRAISVGMSAGPGTIKGGPAVRKPASEWLNDLRGDPSATANPMWQKLEAGLEKVASNKGHLTQTQIDEFLGEQRRLAASKPHFDTPEFNKWFTGSRAVDADNAPLTLYHGSPNHVHAAGTIGGGFDTFDRLATSKIIKGRQPGMDSVGSWFSDLPTEKGAEMYSGQGSIYPVHLNVRNPWEPKDFNEFLSRMHAEAGSDLSAVRKKGTPAGRVDPEPLREWLKSQGYDGIKFPKGSVDGADQSVWVALHPNQIKSATGNNGKFDVTNPSIAKARGGAAGVARFAEGGASDDISWDAPKEDISWHSDAEPADHGLSERQKLSPIGKALSPITGYWDTYQRMRNEAYKQAGEGLHQMTHPDSLIDPKAHGIQDVATGAANTAIGGLNYLIGSPINAAYRSVVGQPLEDTTGIPREQTEFAAQLLTPGLGFTRLPKAPGTVADAAAVARAAGRPGETAGVADGSAPRIRTLDGPELDTPKAQANRALGEEFDIPYTRGQATEDPGAIRFEDMAARGTYGDEMQGIAKPAFDDQFEAIQRAGQRVGQTVSRGEQPLNTPADAASSLATEVGDRASAARATRDSEVAAAAQDEERLRSGVQQSEINIGREIAGQNPMLENPRQAGEVVSNALRETAAGRRADFRARYDEFGRMEGDIPVDQVRGMGTRIREDLSHSEQPVVIDDHLTPAASRALQMLDEQSATPTIQNRAAPRAVQTPDTQISGVTIQGIDRMRRHLVAFYKAAQRGSEDQRAVRGIMNSFDQQVEAAVSDGLFRGDPRALDVLRRARASYSQYQREFHPQGAGDDVGTAMRRIVERNATPEETANMILGSGKIGQAGLPVRLADRLEQILGNQSESWSAIRQAIWQKASQVRSGAAGEIDAARSARSIQDFADSSLARRMFSPDEIRSMRSHAQASRDLDGIIEATSTARANRAQDVYQQAFGTEGLTGSQKQVFQRMVEGTAQPEEITQSLFGVISGGNPANASRAIAAVERIVGADSPVMGTVRNGVWQKLTQNPFGKDPQGQQKLVQGINEFLNGKGRTIAHQLYSPEERALMQRYSEAVRRTIINKYSRTNSDTAVATGAAAQKQAQQRVGAIASTLMSMLHVGPVGHMGGNYVAKKIGEIAGKSANSRSVQALRDSVNDVVPPAPPMTSGRAPRVPSTIRPLALPRVPQSRDDRKDLR